MDVQCQPYSLEAYYCAWLYLYCWSTCAFSILLSWLYLYCWSTCAFSTLLSWLYLYCWSTSTFSILLGCTCTAGPTAPSRSSCPCCTCTAGPPAPSLSSCPGCTCTAGPPAPSRSSWAVPVLLVHLGLLDPLVLSAPVLEPDLDLGLTQPQTLSQLTAPAIREISTSNIQLISYKRFLECTLIQWRLSIYP